MTTVDDLKEPDGELDLELLFPDLTVSQAEDRVQVWIDQAVADAAVAGIVVQSDIDRGSAAYAYYRAYKSVYQRLSAQPSSKNVQDAGISASMTQAQIDSFRQKYLAWEAVWVGVLSSIITTDIVGPATVAIKTEVNW